MQSQVDFFFSVRMPLVVICRMAKPSWTMESCSTSCYIRTIVDAAAEVLFFKLGIAHSSPFRPPCVKRSEIRDSQQQIPALQTQL